MDTRRLHLLLSLSRLGSMRAVAETHHLTTSSVSQQIAALAKETGAQLIEPEGRRVRLTPAGQRLAEHAVTILAAVDSARLDLDPDAEPAGTVRVGGFATGIRLSLLSIAAELAQEFPNVHSVISEYEPIQAFALLTNDDLDLALTYDYNLAPASPGPVLETVALWSVPWGLGVPADTPDGPAEIADYADRTWIVNSRNTADEDAVRTLASLAGFAPRIAHEIDSPELVEDLIIGGYGVGLLPIGRPTAQVARCYRWPNPRPSSPPTLSRDKAGQHDRRCGPCSIGCAHRREPNCHGRTGLARCRETENDSRLISGVAQDFEGLEPSVLAQISPVGIDEGFAERGGQLDHFFVSCTERRAQLERAASQRADDVAAADEVIGDRRRI